MSTQNVIIIGGGMAGLSAALYLARAGLTPFVFAGSPPGGQLMLTSEVENFPGRESILGSELIDVLRKQATKFGTTIIDENVKSVNLVGAGRALPVRNDESPVQHAVESASGKEYSARAIIIATGAKALWMGLPSETRLRGKGVSACATCDGFFFKNKIVAVIGGGDSALEEALTLTKFAKDVVIIHRKMEFRASKIMQERVKKHPHIHLFLNAEVTEFLGEQRVQGLRIKISPSDKSILSKTVSELEALSPALLQTKVEKKDAEYIYSKIVLDGVFVAIGHRPDTDLFKGQIAFDQKGYILTTAMYALAQLKADSQTATVTNNVFDVHYQTMTSALGVFGAGDCVDHVYRQASTAAGMGVQAALDTERWIENPQV